MDIALKCTYSIHGWTYKHPFRKTKKQTDQNPITHTYVKLFIPTPEKDNNKKPRFIKTL